ncbi:MAG: fibronectin-binding domain-containing protein [Candidatus Heimdallarchaeota archaeon]|nr:fibronectin-binding domain-containing protein [Candidatus Heimdallarchaeota archaeon]
MKKMSSMDIYVISRELQPLIGYRVDNIYRDSDDRYYLFKFKGKGVFRSPMLLIEPGVRFYLTEYKHSIPERPSDKIMAIRKHLKGAELVTLKQVEFDRIIQMEFSGKQNYNLYVELFGTHPNFVLVGEQNRVISALWYKKMRHRDLLPGKEFFLPPSRGKSVLAMEKNDIIQLLETTVQKDIEVVRFFASELGGGGILIEEILKRADIPKNKKITDISPKDIENFLLAITSIKGELNNPIPSVCLTVDESPFSYQPINLISADCKRKFFENLSKALDHFYISNIPRKSEDQTTYSKQKKKIIKVLTSQEKAIEEFYLKKDKYKELGDLVYQNFSEIENLLKIIVDARRKNISWEEIIFKLKNAKEKGIKGLQIFKSLNPDRAIINIKLDSEEIEVDFRKSPSEIANEYYQLSKKASKKIIPAQKALAKTKLKLEQLNENIEEKKISDSIILQRRKRNWYEKYHWSISPNGFLIIGGRDISSNEYIVKRRMTSEDIFFHADLRGAPYTILIMNSSEKAVKEADINTAAKLAAVYSSGWKAGYSAIDVYYVSGENVSFTAPSGEYIPRGGIMVRGSRNFVKGVEMILSIGVDFRESNAMVICGSKEHIEQISPVVVTIKPGSTPKGKLAKQIQNIFYEKINTNEDKAKVKGIDLNEFVKFIPHDSMISEVD